MNANAGDYGAPFAINAVSIGVALLINVAAPWDC
jgi:hypothetical protein